MGSDQRALQAIVGTLAFSVSAMDAIRGRWAEAGHALRQVLTEWPHLLS